MTKIVIDIDDKIYKDIKDGYTCPEYADEIINLIPDAIVLPKGHGRLIDGDKILDEIRKREEEPNYQHEGEDWCVGMCMAESAIEFAPTIIEADKEI